MQCIKLAISFNLHVNVHVDWSTLSKYYDL